MRLWHLLRAVLEAEALRLLRSRELWVYLMLPSFLAVPSIAAGGVLVVTAFSAADRVAVPTDTPAELDLGPELEEAEIVAVWTEDPAGAFARGEVDAAIVGWVEGDGVAGPTGAYWPLTGWRWRAEVVGGDNELFHRLQGAVRAAGDQRLEDEVRLAGGDPAFDLWVADVRRLAAESGTAEERLRRLVLAYLAFSLGLVGVMTVVGFTASERQEGLVETLAATAAPPWAWVGARVLVVTVAQLTAGTTLFASVRFVLASMGADFGLLLPEAWGLRLGVAMYTINAGCMLVGAAIASVRVAIGVGSYVLFAAGALMTWGALGSPRWVPLAGLVSARDAPGLLLAVATSLGLATILLGLAGFRLDGDRGGRP